MPDSPLTDEELERIERELAVCCTPVCDFVSAREVRQLLAEVRRLRAELGQRSGAEWQRDLAQLRTHPSLDAVLRVIGGGSGSYAECAELLVKLLRG